MGCLGSPEKTTHEAPRFTEAFVFRLFRKVKLWSGEWGMREIGW